MTFASVVFVTSVPSAINKEKKDENHHQHKTRLNSSEAIKQIGSAACTHAVYSVSERFKKWAVQITIPFGAFLPLATVENEI